MRCVYRQKQQQLEGIHEDVEYELRCLMDKPGRQSIVTQLCGYLGTKSLWRKETVTKHLVKPLTDLDSFIVNLYSKLNYFA